MKCSKCNSENVQAQVITKKNSIIGAVMLIVGGIGLMFLGIIGGIFGALLGFLIGGIIKSFMNEIRETMFVCQECGHTFSPTKNKTK